MLLLAVARGTYGGGIEPASDTGTVAATHSGRARRDRRLVRRGRAVRRGLEDGLDRLLTRTRPGWRRGRLR